MVFDWEETRSPLPTDLAHLWKRYGGKDHEKFNVKEFLASIKKFDSIPLKPPENNFGVAGAARFGKVDKALRLGQQFLLHLLNVPAALYERIQSGKATGAEVKSLMQQQFTFTLATYHKLQDERRENTLPGTGTHEGEVLFGKEELASLREKKSLSALGQKTKGMPQASGAVFISALLRCDFIPSSSEAPGVDGAEEVLTPGPRKVVPQADSVAKESSGKRQAKDVEKALGKV